MSETQVRSMVQIADIKIGERQRTGTGDITGLANSIQENGLFHAIVLNKDLQLIAGFRRLTACVTLGWVEIPAHIMDKPTPADIKKCELEENIRREDISWIDRTKAINELHNLNVEIFGEAVKGSRNPKGWSQEKTAEKAGVTKGRVSQSLKANRILMYYPEVEKCQSESEAVKVALNIARQEIRAALTLEIDEEVQANGESVNLIEGDVTIEVLKLPSESVDFIHADPPFAIELDSSAVFRDSLNKYRDDTGYILEMYNKLAPELFRVLKPDRHMLFWFAVTWYEQTYKALTNAGFVVDPLPVVWDKMQHTFPPGDIWFANGYMVAFHCRKGGRGLFQKRRNVFNVSLYVKEKTVVGFPEMPIALTNDILDIFTLPGEVVFEVFGGSGVMVESCIAKNRKVIACELDHNRMNAIKVRVSK